MISIAAVCKWLECRFEEVKDNDILVVPGPLGREGVPDMPDRVVVITGYAGLGHVMDGAFTIPYFQARCRGYQGSYESAEALALKVDRWFLEAEGPVWGYWVENVDHVSGDPAPISPVDTGDRTSFVCTYRAVSSTEPEEENG